MNSRFITLFSPQATLAMICGVIGIFLLAQLVGLYLGALLVFPHKPALSVAEAIGLGSLNGTVTAISICFTGLVMLFIVTTWVALKRYFLLQVQQQNNPSAIKKIPTVKQYLAIGQFRLGVAIGMLGILLLFVIASESLTYYLDANPTEFLQYIYDSAHPRWLLIFAMVVVAPIYEEFMFRGLIWTALREQVSGNAGVWFASIFSSVLFAIIHLQYGIYEISTIMILAMIFCLARIKSGSLLLPIILHMINNGLAMWQFISINGY